jgi:hypothetical protein
MLCEQFLQGYDCTHCSVTFNVLLYNDLHEILGGLLYTYYTHCRELMKSVASHAVNPCYL